MEFLAANLNSCERDRFGQVDSDKDSLVARINYNEASILLMGKIIIRTDHFHRSDRKNAIGSD
jgi:hypothetical protein